MQHTYTSIQKLIRWCAAFCCIVLLFCAQASSAQKVSIVHSGDLDTLDEVPLIDSAWLFHAGETSIAKQPLINITGWDTIHKTEFGKTNKPAKWQGIGWFRIWIKVDTALVGKKLSLRINHDGASEIFVDGKPVGGYGKIGHSAKEMEAVRALRDLIPLWINDTRPHLITIHYSNFVNVYDEFYGFQVWIGDYNALSKRVIHTTRLFNYVNMFAAAKIILGLLHFLFFLYYPRQKLNLYYAFFVFLIGINGISVYYYYLTRDPATQYVAEFMTFECKVLIMWLGVLLLYVLNYGSVPRWRLIALTGVSLLYFTLYALEFWVLKTQSYEDHFSIVFFICVMDGFWSAFQVIRRKQKGAWLIGVGVGVIILVYFFAWADVFGLWSYSSNSMRVFVMGAGELVLPICLSLYLALDFAGTNQTLVAKLAEVERLSARALAQETEKRELIATEAKRLDELVQQRTAELSEQTDKLREMDTVKSRFFTNITHEFKTPLTLIINPAKELLSGSVTESARQHIRLILNNAARLLQLINQLLDLSKVENGVMELNLAPVDLVALIKIHSLSYESLAKQKGIALHFNSDWDTLWIRSDRDKLDKIILNLLSNAIKFTDKGAVEIFLQKDSEAPDTSFIFTVRDTGRGIPANKLLYIFARFYQADPSDTRSAEGSGIGLALAKDLVELMGGQIRAESAEGLFTEIIARMPYEAATSVPEIVPEKEPDWVLLPSVTNNGELEITDDGKPVILIIEDHQELRDFIHQLLADKYRVLSAADGGVGITMGLEYIPNLIITDLMMPLVDGYQVSTTLKRDEKTSHIPIVILTAKADMDSRIQGIETGADAYLQKPFDKRELFALIENLINVRNQLRKHYSSRDLWLNNSLSMPSIERDFIARVRSAVESHLNEEGYSADQLARDMGLSRTQLHRKLKGLIGQAPGELIRIIRLQYAHDLLQQQAATVAEVAYMVGFGSPASFSASFSRHFGFPPKKVNEN